LPRSPGWRIDRLERQLDDLKRIPGQPGPQGPPGKDGNLPIVKVFQKDAVYYTGDVVICDGSTYQALRDTGQSVNHADWACLARAGRDGCDGRSPNACGTYDAREKYKRLDIVALDGAAFIASRDDPGLCPGDGWQLLSRQDRLGNRGENGERGPRGEKGEKGEPGTTVVSWQLDRQRYRVSPLMSDGKVGPMLELRRLLALPRGGWTMNDTDNEWLDARIAQRVEQQLEQRLAQEREYWRCHLVDLIAAERERLDALVEKKHEKVIELLKVAHKEIFDWVQRVLEQSKRQAMVGFDRLEAKSGQVVLMGRPDDDDGEPPPSTH
jgi:hypothetical protein